MVSQPSGRFARSCRAPKAFHDQLTAYLESIGYTRSAYNRCLFYRRLEDGKLIMFSIHVDDFAVAATDDALIVELCTALKLKYVIKEIDTLEDFFGVHMHGAISRSSASQSARIDQEANRRC